MSRRRSYSVRCSVPCGRAPSLASFAAPRLARSVRGSHARFGALSHFCDGRGAWHPDKATRCGRACRIARSEPQCQVRAGSGWRRAHFPGLRVTFMRLNAELSTAPACNLSRERESGPGATARARSDATGPSWLTSSTSARLAPHSSTGAHAERIARTSAQSLHFYLARPSSWHRPPGPSHLISPPPLVTSQRLAWHQYRPSSFERAPNRRPGMSSLDKLAIRGMCVPHFAPLASPLLTVERRRTTQPLVRLERDLGHAVLFAPDRDRRPQRKRQDGAFFSLVCANWPRGRAQA